MYCDQCLAFKSKVVRQRKLTSILVLTMQQIYTAEMKRWRFFLDEENLKNVVDNKRYKKGCQSSIHNHQSSEIWWIIFQNSTSSFFPSLIIWFTTIFELQERDNPMAATTMRTEEEEWGGLTNILHFSHHFWLFKAMDQSSSSFYSQQRWETDRRFYFHDKSTPNYGKKFSNLHEISFKVQPVFCRHVKHVKTKY